MNSDQPMVVPDGTGGRSDHRARRKIAGQVTIIALVGLLALRLPYLASIVAVNHAQWLLLRLHVGPSLADGQRDLASREVSNLYGAATALDRRVADRPYGQLLRCGPDNYSQCPLPTCTRASYVSAVLLGVAQALVGAGQVSTARELYARLASICPWSFEIQQAWSKLEERSGELDKALAVQEKVTQLWPGHPYEAPDDTRSAADLPPNGAYQLAEARYKLGRLYAQNGKPAEAIAAMEQATETYPPGRANPYMYYDLGVLYERDGSTDKARWAFQQALVLMPDMAPASRKLKGLSASK